MTIQLTPEDEKRVEERLRSGVFHSVEEVIHHALQVQEAGRSEFPAVKCVGDCRR